MDDTPAHWGRGGRDRMVVGFKLPMQSVPITTNVVSSNLDQGEMYNIMSSSLSVICDKTDGHNIPTVIDSLQGQVLIHL